MNSYRLLFMKDIKVFKNYILEIKRNPKKLIIYSLYILWIGSIIFNFITNSNAKNMSNLKRLFGPQIVGSVFLLISIIGLAYYILKGMKSSTTFFSMGDVHILFPAPISSKKILLYNILKKTLANFFLYGIFILALSPTIGNVTTVDIRYISFLYFGYISIVLMFEPINFLIFTLSTKYNIKNAVKIIVYIFLGIFIIYILVSLLSSEKFYIGVLKSLNADFINHIPVIGWAKVVFMTPIIGYTTTSLIYLVLQILALFGIIICTYMTADDYYEDVLGATESKELRKKIKRGQVNSKKTSFILRNKRVNVKASGRGPWALIWKNKVEYDRTGIHPYISLLTIIALIGGIITGFIARKLELNSLVIYISNGGLAYMLFLLNIATANNHELSKPYVYLIPGTYAQKIIAMNVTDIIRMTINVILYNLCPLLFIKTNIVISIVMVLFVLSFYILNLMSNFIIRVTFPNSVDQKALFPLFLMLQIVLLVLPSVIAGIIMTVIFNNKLAFFIASTATNLLICVLLLSFSSLIFNRIEWKQ
ncbi:putative ABC exporter domain-containing protein [Abyssisolibacter fermentans]|uniref:putative ABC exporter domain-containing protein n=1 Tax=Abyssisolibacter fermentans TaxID=1766203 RepID=UPI00082CDB1A|nr:putative ABC exporter domain-containing protein [Abyssisolibacter fermentans]